MLDAVCIGGDARFVDAALASKRVILLILLTFLLQHPHPQ